MRSTCIICTNERIKSVWCDRGIQNQGTCGYPEHPQDWQTEYATCSDRCRAIREGQRNVGRGITEREYLQAMRNGDDGWRSEPDYFGEQGPQG